ncbi:hypothetical protein JTE90_000087 [Oedothorax gibbosus]|uniref:RNA-directed DNA polymerase n=1 Tax=Oedothorax gibbosus TaxID=931172 RepID=A0AAV6UCM4_9ARAC|nr:hypothetical protein JTE90_000087 [Oedothorax gibbosus]
MMTYCHERAASHLGIAKTKDALFKTFYWPNCYREVEAFVKSCDLCQRVGKPQDKKKAPLKLVPVITEIFSKINVDAVGPLPVTPSGNKYLITAVCMSSKYPDAIPVENLKSTSIIDALLQVFSRMGFPKELQTDQGTSFTSALTTEFLERFGIKVVRSSVYHPQSNPVERMHRTLKRILRVLCLESGPDWEKILPQALFALRTVTHDSTGFTPAELVHGRNLKTPVMLLYDKLTEEDQEEDCVVNYVFELMNRMEKCQELAIRNMEHVKEKKLWYDKKSVERQFKPGDLVLVVASSRPTKLSVHWIGPGETEDEEEIPVLECVDKSKGSKLCELLEETRLKSKLSEAQQNQLEKLLNHYSELFSNEPGCTDLAKHDIGLEEDKPIIGKPYRMSPRQTEILKAEVNKMLELNVIERGDSDFTSPLILVEVPGKDPRPCIDYRRLNKVTRTQYFPIPNIEELIEKVSSAKYISVLDLTRGYWQIPLSKQKPRDMLPL